jgi:hypothetical protein
MADMTIVRNPQNTEPLIKPINLLVDPVIQMFAQIAHPIAVSVHRYLGVNDPTNDPQNVLRDTCYSVAADAFAAMNTVLYRKAIRLSPGYAQFFAGNPRGDKFQSLNLITLFASSIGPIERERDTYRCLFIPYFTRNEVDNVLANAMYSARLSKQFYMNVARAYTQVELTTIDPYNDVSSPWWMLYVTTQNNNRTTYCPISFNDIDNATVLASLLLDACIYPLPGPLHTAAVEFVAPNNDNLARDDIPANMRDDLHINASVPAVHIIFDRVANATNAQLMGYGHTQGDPNLVNVPHISIRDPTQWMANEVSRYDDYINHLEAVCQHLSIVSTMTDAQRAAIDPNNPPRGYLPPPGNAPPRPATPTGHAPTDAHANVSLYRATILYFDHVIAKDFPTARREAIITECIIPSPPS